jgi:MoxR-like ATPase
LENFERTVRSGVDRTEVEKHTDLSFDDETVRMWGTKETVESSWSGVSPGDFLFFYRNGTYEYAAEVTGTEKNEKLGRAVWPNHEEDAPWVCIIYLEPPRELGLDSSEVHHLAGYDIDYPMGFSPLNEMGIGGLRGKYGSIESLVYGENRTSDIDVTADLSVSIPTDVLDGLYFPEDGGTGSEAIVEKVEDALNAGKHIIFTGPPGTGKTEIARRVSRHLAESRPGVYTGFEMTTATADWSTFETVGGYMPGEEGNGALGFEAGQVLRCFKEDDRQRNDLLVIDEINRSDIDKSFGQLFTLLSGQGIQLPFKRDGQDVEIIPGSKTDDDELEPHEYVAPSSWRILATMNSYDKTSLYEMSYAFMRRFAFIYVDAPEIPDSDEEREQLVERYAGEWGIDAGEALYRDVGRIWYELNENVAERPIGPAIVKDILQHASGSSGDSRRVLTEAVLSYVFPQLEGVRRREQVVSGLASLDQLDERRLKDVGADLLQIRFDE